MSGPAPTTSFTLSAILPTSADARTASENFSAERVAAIVTVTGRSIAALSRHPEEQEIALLPGTLLLPVGHVEVAGLPNPVVLLAETGSAPGLPETKEELRRFVDEQVSAALQSNPVTVTSPGRFSPRRS
ncbi:hypothetical protein [Mycobacterium sp. C31M]